MSNSFRNQTADTVVMNIGQLLTMDQTGAGGGPLELAVLEKGALALAGGKVLWAGTEADMPLFVNVPEQASVIDAAGGVVTPGFMECHTHLVFAGSREREFQMRMEGKSYLEILRAGGGILSTVAATRKASEDELVEAALPRLETLLGFGVTTCEIKSGYGLETEAELKMLRVVQRLAGLQPVTLVPTFLGAHAVPAEHRDRRQRYVELVVKDMIPAVAGLGLAEFCDIYVEKSAFSPDEAETVLTAARDAGMRLKLHAGQFNDLGGAELGARLGAVSIDHLDQVSDRGLELMAERGVVAVALPGAAFFVREKVGRLDRVRRAGVRVAVSTDLNPGSCMTENLPLMMTMAVVDGGLGLADALAGVTAWAAAALGLPHPRGTLAPGAPGDLVIHDVPDWRHIVYHYALSHVKAVMKGGRVVCDRSSKP